MPAPRRPLPEDVARLGTEMATYKRNNPKAWKALVQRAHSRGFTVAAQFSGVPDPLKERTRSSLTQQALNTVNAAYKRDESALDEQERRVAAIDAKRQADETAYQQWVADKQASLAAEANAADSALASRVAEAQQVASTAWQAQQESARQAAGQVPGRVTDPQQSRALDFSAEAQRATAQAQARTDRVSQLVGLSAERGRGLREASLANGQAQRMSIQADTAKARTQIFDARYKLALTKSADAVKETTRLLDREVEKANANREYAAAAEKLGIAAEGQRLDAKVKERQADLADKKLTLAQLIADNQKAAAQARIDVEYDRLEQQKGKAAADRALKRELERARAGRETQRQRTANNKISDSRRRQSAEAIKTISKISRDVARLNKKHKDGKMKGTVRDYLASNGASDIEIDVANDLWRNNGKLSFAGRRKARTLGIIVPSYWIP